MFLQPLDLTTALRPFLLPDEVTLFVQDTIGLYEGKYKIPDFQNGHAYLTTHRVCYVDTLEPRLHSVAFDLKDIDRYDYYGGFLKSSAKITFYPKSHQRSSFQGSSQLAQQSPSRNSTPSPLHHVNTALPTNGFPLSVPRPSTATWVCAICSYSNPVPSTFDPSAATANTPLPPCLACGIKPSFPHMLKAAIASASGRRGFTIASEAPAQPLLERHHQYHDSLNDEYSEQGSSASLRQDPKFQCPRCTFLNHSSLLSCELCGAPLSCFDVKPFEVRGNDNGAPRSPGPVFIGDEAGGAQDTVCIKLSFRNGGDKPFHERLKGAMVQRKWLLRNAPPIPEPIRHVQNKEESATMRTVAAHPSPIGVTRATSAGIAGLERRGLESRAKNEAVIGSAFEDLDALMASAKEIRALAESFASQVGSEFAEGGHLIAGSVDMVTRKDMFGSSAGSESLYLSELSRNLAEYLTDDAKGILRQEGGIMSLVDLWATFNRARGGVELISPTEFQKAAKLWELLKLPVRLRQFKNGLFVVQQADRTDDNTVAQLLSWLQDLLSSPLNADIKGDGNAFGRGITAQETAQHFCWSVGVAVEELEMAEEKGALCREESIEGVRFWQNWFLNSTEDEDDDRITVQGSNHKGTDDIMKNLKATGLL